MDAAETKVCTGCSSEKPLTEFNLKNRETGRRTSRCKGCLSSYGKTHYQRNRQLAIDRAAVRNKAYNERNRRYVFEFLLEHPCLDCGEDDILVLEFDHVKGIKTANVADLLGDAISLKRLQGEIDKCEVVCVNCHRKRTLHRQRQSLPA